MEVDLYDIDLGMIEDEVSEEDLEFIDNFGIELTDEEKLRAAFWARRQLDSIEENLTIGDYITMDVSLTSIGRMVGIKNNVTGEQETVTDLDKL